MSEKSSETIDIGGLVLKAMNDHGQVSGEEHGPITSETRMSDIQFKGDLQGIAPILDVEDDLSIQLGMNIDGLLSTEDVERAKTVGEFADLTKTRLCQLLQQVA